MLSSFKAFQRNLRILRSLMFTFLIILSGPGLYFFLSSAAAITRTVGILSLVLTFCLTLMFLGYDTMRDQQQSSTNMLLESKRLFIRYVSHEIRSPLNTVHLGLRLLIQEMQGLLDSLESASMDPLPKARLTDWVALIDDVEESTRKVVRVLNDLIHADDLASGTLRMARKIVNMWRVVESAVQPFRAQAAQRGICLTVEMYRQKHGSASDSDAGALGRENESRNWHNRRGSKSFNESEGFGDVRVLGDEVKLAQVVGMLVGNAVNSVERSGRVTVTVCWEPEQHSESRVLDGGAPQISSNRRDTVNSDCGVTPCPSSSDHGGHKNHTADSSTSAPDAQFESAGWMIVTVHDSGPGLTPEQEAQIFGEDVQFNLELLTAGEGGGLELWVSKGIIELHHGRLSATSSGFDEGVGEREEKEEGRGSSFKIELPAVVLRTGGGWEESGENIEAEAEVSSSDSLAFDLRYNVLVVEDSTPSRKLLCRLLSNLGCRCTQAGDGLECIELVRNLSSRKKPPFDFILMDFEMPRMNGPEAAYSLRRDGIFTPIIGITGNVLPEDQDYFMSAGADRVLRKPLSLPLLEKTLVDIIMRKGEVSYIM